jgi:hypothetical protein
MQTRVGLIVLSFILCFIGAQFMAVDKIVLHEGLLPVIGSPADSSASTTASSQRQIDLPDSGGFALVAAGIVCLMFSLGLKKFREK